MNRPNLLFLYTDEQAINTLATYGNTQIEMPDINRLAERSVVFDQAYVTQPVYTPSRSTLLTGLYPHTNGCTQNNIPLRTDDDWRRLIANYRGLCSLADTHVGTILDTLEDCGIDDDTIVVSTSDHGYMMGGTDW